MPWAGTVASTMPSVAIDLRQGLETLAGDHAPIYHLHTMTQAGLISELRIATERPPSAQDASSQRYRITY